MLQRPQLPHRNTLNGQDKASAGTEGRQWQIQEAKAEFGALVRAASTAGPQTIAVGGRPVAVVLSAEDYGRLRGPQLSLAELMARSPFVGVELDLERDRRPTCRPATLGDGQGFDCATHAER